jgi:hypothetical protein
MEEEEVAVAVAGGAAAEEEVAAAEEEAEEAVVVAEEEVVLAHSYPVYPPCNNCGTIRASVVPSVSSPSSPGMHWVWIRCDSTISLACSVPFDLFCYILKPMDAVETLVLYRLP